MSQGNPVDPQKGKTVDPVATLYPITDRPPFRIISQTQAESPIKTKMRPCNHGKCGYEVFFLRQ